MPSPTARARAGRPTPDSHSFPTRPYDLVKEFVIALVVVSLLSLGLAAALSSPDESSITLKSWAQAASADVVATATAELAGSSASATYGPPYNSNAEGQKVLGIPLQKLGGVRLPVHSEQLVLGPLANTEDPAVSQAVSTWTSADTKQRTAWANAYSDALAKAPDGDPAQVGSGDFGPVPAITAGFLALAKSGGLEGSLSSGGNFYGGDQSRTLLLLSDGAYLEDQARARKLGGDQWGMMNETGNYPGQPWMWLYTFWYQVKPFSTSDNADAQVWALMMVLTLGLVFLPLIPGLRSIPRWVPVHRLIWRDYYRSRRA
jgi:hypothetical protein